MIGPATIALAGAHKRFPIGASYAGISPVTITLGARPLVTSGSGSTSRSISPVIFTFTPFPVVIVPSGTGFLTPAPITLTPVALVCHGSGNVSTSISPAIFALTPVSLDAIGAPSVRSISPVTLTETAVALSGGATAVATSISPAIFMLTPVALTGFAALPAVKLYLVAIDAANFPSVGEKSAALPVGSFKGTLDASKQRLSLSTTKGVLTTAANSPLTSLAQTAHQDNYIARFSSAALQAQTFGAGTWTFAFTSVGSINGNAFATVSLYVWNPTGSSVRGYIYDSDTPMGTEWGANPTGRVVTFTGVNVAASAGDVLVIEVWTHATQLDASGRSNIFYYGNTIEPTEGSSGNTASASYLLTPSGPAF